MVTRAPFLKTRYGAYFHRDIPQEDDELTHVDPDTPAASICVAFGSRFVSLTSCATCRIGSKSSARSSWCFATGAARWVSSSCTVHTAAPRWSLGSFALRVYAAATMGGSLQQTERYWRPQASRGRARLRKGSITGPIRPMRGTALSSRVGAPRPAAVFSQIRQLQASRLSPDPRSEIFLSVQLAADHGKCHGPGPYGVSLHHRQRCGLSRYYRSSISSRRQSG